MENIQELRRRIEANVSAIRERIAESQLKAGTNSIKIIGVTKNRSPEEINCAIMCGIDYIGENKVQEAEKKLPLITQNITEFHYIGHLQKNKVNKLLKLKPSLLHSLDSLTTAQAINAFMEKNDIIQEVLVQVNTSDEQSKFGLENDFEQVLSFVERLKHFKHLRIRGLMTLAIYSGDEKKVRNCFKKLRYHLENINKENILSDKLDILSMGMSNDYQIAIEEGSNMVRIGSAIFD